MFVMRVTEGGPADAGGVRRGDMILAVDGRRSTTLESFYKRLWARAKADEEVRITLKRGEDVRTLTLHGVDRMSTMKRPEGI